MLTEKKLYSEFDHYKRIAERELKKEKIESSMLVMQLACILAKNYYLCYEDDTLEDLVRLIAARIPYKEDHDRKRNKYVFYDTHTTDNIALTQQYLGALMDWGVEFVYMTTRSLKSSRAKLIASMLKGYDKVTVHEIPEIKSLKEKAIYIRELLYKTDAGTAFVQTTADDVAGNVAFCGMGSICKYYIDLSDHSFWLGAKLYDKYITFRNYGYNICVQSRRIPAERVLIQPFYPTLISKEYRGIPCNDEKSIKILSGGRLEKIYDKKDTFLKLVKKILDQNGNVEFYYSGGGAFGKIGQTSYIESQIKKLGIGERFHMLGFRDDIISLMKHMDIYMGTYPMGGGLMTQQAASMSLPIVQYVTAGLSSSVNEFLTLDDKDSFVFFEDEGGFLRRVKELVDSEELRKYYGQIYQNSVMTLEQFNRELRVQIEAGKYIYPHKDYRVECDHYRENQISVENYSFHSYPRIIIKNRYVRHNEVFKYIFNAIKFVFYSDKKWLAKKLLNK